MRNVKRILCSIVAFAVLMSCMAFSVSAASFPDVPDGHANKAAIDQLSDLGIIQGDDQGNFNPDNNVNRAEFTALVMRFIGQSGTLGTVSVENAPFPDLSDSAVSWAIGDITIARNMGIINGYEDGTFRPTDPVAYEEAVKMIVCALGYGKAIVPATDAAQWFQPYMTIATEMGFTKRAGGAIGVAATRGCIAQMLYDAKDVKTLDANGKVSDKSVLQDKLGSTKATGIIISDQNTCLTSPDTKTRENEIQILTKEDGKDRVYTYTTTNNSYKNWIGYQVDLYYTEDRSDDARTLVSASKKGTKEVTVDAKDLVIEDSTARSIVYYPEDASKEKSYSISSENVVIYNDKLYGSSAASSTFDPSMLPIVGNVTLIDTTGDGSYDVIKINKYDVYIVTGSTTTDYTITDNTSGKAEPEKLVLNVDDSASTLKIVDTAGKEVKFGSITSKGDNKGSIVCHKQSNPDNGGEILRTAVVNNEKKSGEIMSIGDSKIKIGDKTYDVSPAAPWIRYKDEANAMKAPSVGDTATFYFDINGAVVSYHKAATVNNQKYGYLMNVSQSDEMDDSTLTVRIMMDNGNTTTPYYTYKSTKLMNPATKEFETFSSAAELERALKSYTKFQNTDIDGTSGVHQLIKYTTRSNRGKTVLDEIIPASTVSASQNIESDVLARLDTVDGKMSMVCSTSGSNKQLKSEDGKVSVTITSTTKIFVVPHDRSETNEYRQGKLADFKNGKPHSVEVFDVSSRIAKAVILYGVDATTAVDAQTPVFVVTEITSDATHDNGDNMACLEGYEISSSSAKESVKMWLSPDSSVKVGDFQIGDVIRCGSDRDGFATVNREDILWNVSNLDGAGIKDYMLVDDTENNKDDWEKAEFVAIHSKIYNYDESNNIVELSRALLAGDEYDESNSLLIDVSNFSGAKILDYSVRNGEVTITSNTQTAAEVLQGSEKMQTFIYRSKGKVRLLIRVSEAK